MCIGIGAILGAVVGIAQAAVGFAQAQQQAAAQEAQHQQNRLDAIAAANDRYAALNRKTLQEQEAASQQLMEKRIEATKAEATAYVASGEAGVTGLSVDALMQDFRAQQARREASIYTNFEYQRMANEDEADATYHQTVGRINSVPRPAKVSAAPYIVQGLGAVAGAFR